MTLPSRKSTETSAPAPHLQDVSDDSYSHRFRHSVGQNEHVSVVDEEEADVGRNPRRSVHRSESTQVHDGGVTVTESAHRHASEGNAGEPDRKHEQRSGSLRTGSLSSPEGDQSTGNPEDLSLSDAGAAEAEAESSEKKNEENAAWKNPDEKSSETRGPQPRRATSGPISKTSFSFDLIYGESFMQQSAVIRVPLLTRIRRETLERIIRIHFDWRQ